MPCGVELREWYLDSFGAQDVRKESSSGRTPSHFLPGKGKKKGKENKYKSRSDHSIPRYLQLIADFRTKLLVVTNLYQVLDVWCKACEYMCLQNLSSLFNDHHLTSRISNQRIVLRCASCCAAIYII